MMRTRKPLVAAMAATGLCFSLGSVLAGTPPVFSDLCGTTVETDTNHYCDESETLTKNCKISVASGVYLRIDGCRTDADGYKVEISGDSNATLRFNNGSLADASKIEVEFEGSDDDENCTSHGIIDVDRYEMSANGDGPKDGKIKFSTECGNIDFDLGNGYGNISVAGVFGVETGDGNIDLMDYSGYGSVSANPDGKIEINAGGDNGRVSSSGVEYSGGTIKITSEGGSGYVGP